MKNKKNIVDYKIIKKQHNGKVYYDLIINVLGMSFQVEPKFLNSKQRALLMHKLKEVLECY